MPMCLRCASSLLKVSSPPETPRVQERREGHPPGEVWQGDWEEGGASLGWEVAEEHSSGREIPAGQVPEAVWGEVPVEPLALVVRRERERDREGPALVWKEPPGSRRQRQEVPWEQEALVEAAVEAEVLPWKRVWAVGEVEDHPQVVAEEAVELLASYFFRQ